MMETIIAGEKEQKMLPGKKTYITAVTVILTSLVAFLNGSIDLAAFIQSASTALIGAFIRSGITMEANKK